MADEYIDKVEVGAKIQMMYIRREMDYGGENDFCRGMRKALRVIENMPCADIQPVHHGRWISEKVRKPDWKGVEHDYFQPNSCSVCHTGFAVRSNYCPNCGARMMMDGDTQ